MTRLRVGTRGSGLAPRQTRWVCDRLLAVHDELTIEEVVITTHGDIASDAVSGRDGSGSGSGPPGRFVSAIEQALLDDRIDLAVHSYKDLPSAATKGLMIAAVPPREVVHDVLVSREPVDLARLPGGFKVGTGSPRRAAQFLRLGGVRIVPIRGNVPTRLAKLDDPDYDGLVLAAAGLKRLGVAPPHRIDLPIDRFVPAPAQGALAIQTRRNDGAIAIVAVMEDGLARRAVLAERAFLSGVSAGCHTPVAALATVDDRTVSLHGQLFSDDYARLAEAIEVGDDPQEVGTRLAERLVRELRGGS